MRRMSGSSSGKIATASSDDTPATRRFSAAESRMNTERSSVTNPIPRCARRKSGDVVSTPPNRISPAMGGSSPASVSNVVVFPAPFGPINATTSPAATSRSTSRTTAMSP